LFLPFWLGRFKLQAGFQPMQAGMGELTLFVVCATLLYVFVVNFFQLNFAGVGWHGLVSSDWNG
jgi:ABC-type transport system involved in cytochrome c biogenesis permease subunit